MPASPDDLFAYLDRLGITHATTAHEPLHTVEESRALRASMPGGHTKNLFMTNKDGDIVLIAAHADSQLKLNQLHKHIGTRRLSFASPDLMQEILGVRPGSVTAFALINDTDRRVRFLVDAALLAYDPVNFHPLINTMTTSISRDGFRTFVESTGRTLEAMDFTAL